MFSFNARIIVGAAYAIALSAQCMTKATDAPVIGYFAGGSILLIFLIAMAHALAARRDPAPAAIRVPKN